MDGSLKRRRTVDEQVHLLHSPAASPNQPMLYSSFSIPQHPIMSNPMASHHSSANSGVIAPASVPSMLPLNHPLVPSIQGPQIIEHILQQIQLVKQQKVTQEFSNWSSILDQLKRWISEFKQSVTTLEEILDQQLLTWPDISKYLHLQNELQLHLAELEIEHQEVQFIIHNPATPPPFFAKLVVIEAPFPTVVTEDQYLPGRIVLRFICGRYSTSYDQQISISEVNVKVVPDCPLNIDIPIQYDSKISQNEIIFNSNTMKFKKPSRQMTVRLQFQVSLHVGGEMLEITSERTEPFIVMANSGNQWEKSWKQLLLHEIFYRRKQSSSFASLARFFNCLDLLVDRITDRYPQCRRHFLLDERLYIHSQLGGDKLQLKREEVETFWDWFGSSFFLLRDATKNLPLWANGVIVGFVSKEKAEEMLNGRPEGAFLVRFSRQLPHRFSLSYVVRDLSIHHSLLPEDDCKLNLAELLLTPRFNTLVYLVFLPPVPNGVQASWMMLPKHEVLQQFQKTKRHAKEDPPDKLKSMGYIPNFN